MCIYIKFYFDFVKNLFNELKRHINFLADKLHELPGDQNGTEDGDHRETSNTQTQAHRQPMDECVPHRRSGATGS